jgi:hypothetical protein
MEIIAPDYLDGGLTQRNGPPGSNIYFIFKIDFENEIRGRRRLLEWLFAFVRVKPVSTGFYCA